MSHFSLGQWFSNLWFQNSFIFLKLLRIPKGFCICGLNLSMLTILGVKAGKVFMYLLLHLKIGPRYPLQVTINNRT